jgi:hypothetical protein
VSGQLSLGFLDFELGGPHWTFTLSAFLFFTSQLCPCLIDVCGADELTARVSTMLATNGFSAAQARPDGKHAT